MEMYVYKIRRKREPRTKPRHPVIPEGLQGSQGNFRRSQGGAGGAPASRNPRGLQQMMVYIETMPIAGGCVDVNVFRNNRRQEPGTEPGHPGIPTEIRGPLGDSRDTRGAPKNPRRASTIPGRIQGYQGGSEDPREIPGDPKETVQYCASTAIYLDFL